MKAGLGTLIFLAGLAAPAAANAAEIIVYQDAYYSGASRHFSGDVRNLADQGFNDRISSIRVVSGFWTVCADANFSGRCENVSGDVSNLSSTGLNDRISSIRLEGGGTGGWDGYDDHHNGRDGIVLYTDNGFGGRQVRLDSDTPNLGTFDFNDRASSLRVEGGTWEVCQDATYRGRCRIVSADVSNLGNLNLNDQLSSVRLVGRDDRQDTDSWWGRDRNDRWERWAQNTTSRAHVYEHVEYRGSHREIDGPVPNLSQVGFGDRISSMRLDGRWQVCEYVNYGGECTILRYDENNLVPLGWNDRISSMRPVGMGAGNQPGLVLFEDVNYQGDRQRLSDDEPNLRNLGFNDITSSLRVREGRWEICEDVNFGGRCQVVAADQNNLHPMGLNDRVSSARRLSDGGPGGHRGITIYEHTNYEGRSRDIDTDVPSLAPLSFNDMLSSFHVHDGTWELCEHVNYAGRCWTYNASLANVVTQGFNDRISSLRRVGPSGGPGGGYGGQIEIFEHTSYAGRSRVYGATVTNLAQEGWNDQISSFRISGPGRWEICDDAGFGGRCQVFAADEPNLVPLNWNDRISSIRYLP